MTGDPAFICEYLGVIARAKSMTKLASETGTLLKHNLRCRGLVLTQ